MNSGLNLFAVFHLNLAYSSIAEDRRAEVISRCYWPLLELIREHNVPAGIEITGYTLEAVAAIDHGWVRELRTLLEAGTCELIGSGDTQLIGPLVPEVVNRWNLQLGHEVYERLLGVRPRIALVNEQAFAAGTIPLYLEAGYEALVMEWDNPASQHSDWDPALRYLPQRAVGPDGSEIPVIWNHSIAFQKFQRYAHGEMDLDEYLAYIEDHANGDVRALPVYGNDVEVFDFRPGRFHTEADLQEPVEWRRINELFRRLSAERRWRAPSALLELLDAPGAGLRLQLGNCNHPIPVKKQRKYNLSRWAITGRNDLWLNTLCHRLCRALEADKTARDDPAQWRRLCRLWASDLRTHIENMRWQAACAEAEAFATALDVPLPGSGRDIPPVPRRVNNGNAFHVSHDTRRNRLHVVNRHVHVTFNTRRGLTIESLAFASHGLTPLIGTVPHGYFDSIELGADFYTGGVVVELPQEHRRITDLQSVMPALQYTEAGVVVSAQVETDRGALRKSYLIAVDEERIEYRIEFPNWVRPMGTLRVGHVTLLPEGFAHGLRFACRNGGEAEEFMLDADCEHTQPASTLVSASAGLGATDGCIEIGDGVRGVELRWDPAQCAAFPMLLHQASKPGALTRVVFSLAELDETTREGGTLLPFSMRITPARYANAQSRDVEEAESVREAG